MDFPDFPLDDDGPENVILFHFEDVTFDIPDEDKLKDWLCSVAEKEEKPFFEVNYIFCSDEYLRKINIEYLNHDYYTDIITFPYDDEAVHGDMFISSERVTENAQTNSVSFYQELYRVMVHGVLHMIGYGDKTPAEEKIMREKENVYLKLLEP